MSDSPSAAMRSHAPAPAGEMPHDQCARSAPRPRNALWIRVGVIAWAATIVLGFTAFEMYDRSPGPPGAPAGVWQDAGFGPLNGRARVLMFVHPRCPCSRSSLAEFERLVAQADAALDPWIVVYRPRSAAAEPWVDSDLWRQAEQMPGVRTRADPDGELARRFGVVTSGHTLAYDAAGRLAYSGGITPTRSGHLDGRGRAALLAALSADGPAITRPVFGCPILPDEPATVGDRSRP